MRAVSAQAEPIVRKSAASTHGLGQLAQALGFGVQVTEGEVVCMKVAVAISTAIAKSNACFKCC